MRRDVRPQELVDALKSGDWKEVPVSSSFVRLVNRMIRPRGYEIISDGERYKIQRTPEGFEKLVEEVFEIDRDSVRQGDAYKRWKQGWTDLAEGSTVAMTRLTKEQLMTRKEEYERVTGRSISLYDFIQQLPANQRRLYEGEDYE